MHLSNSEQVWAAEERFHRQNGNAETSFKEIIWQFVLLIVKNRK